MSPTRLSDNKTQLSGFRSGMLYWLSCFAFFVSPIGLVYANDIQLVSLSSEKALFIINGKSPKAFTVGSALTPDTKLVSLDRQSATLEVAGKRRVLILGQAVLSKPEGKGHSVTLNADERGHFYTQLQINGGSSIRAVVDTGASFVAIPAEEARRLGIDYKKGRLGYSSTANGIVPVYVLQVDSIKVGDLEIFQVLASVHEGALPMILLGNSFLKRVNMKTDGDKMTLTKK